MFYLLLLVSMIYFKEICLFIWNINNIILKLMFEYFIEDIIKNNSGINDNLLV
jgi:hypothetical protein